MSGQDPVHAPAPPDRAAGARGPLARLATACVTLAALALCLMAAVQGWQVFARYALNDSPSWTEPAALLLMNAAMMFGAAAGVRAGAHFGFFLLPQTARGGTRRALLALSHGLTAAISVLLSIWAARLVIDGWDVPIAGAPLPQGLSFVPLACAGALMAAFAIEQLIGAIRDPDGGP